MRLAEHGLGFFSRRLGKKVQRISAEVAAAFRAYAWPGNLRELRNVIERAVILAGGDTLTLADLPEEFSHRPDTTVQVGGRVSLEALETEHIRRILAVSATLEEAARTLEIDPATLYRKRQKLGLL
jgi:NtrC-family two-component system response regulator AlgB